MAGYLISYHSKLNKQPRTAMKINKKSLVNTLYKAKYYLPLAERKGYEPTLSCVEYQLIKICKITTPRITLANLFSL
jgi:hypothetical protein